MENTKNRYYSKTIWGQLIAVICFFLSMTGIVDIDETTQSQLVENVLNIVGAIAQVYAIYGRVVSNKKIG